MTGSGFRPRPSGEIGVNEAGLDLPFRSRDTYLAQGAAYLRASKGEIPGFALVVPESPRHEIQVFVAQAKPRETAGLLGGRVFRDVRGPWVLVTTVACDPREGELGFVSLEPKLVARLRNVINELAPSADVVGWFHSHSRSSGFSRVDFGQQRVWTNRYHVGLLAYMQSIDNDWCRAYRGPDAEGLELVDLDGLLGPDLRQQAVPPSPRPMTAKSPVTAVTATAARAGAPTAVRADGATRAVENAEAKTTVRLSSTADLAVTISLLVAAALFFLAYWVAG